jgi:hypothetical protein
MQAPCDELRRLGRSRRVPADLLPAREEWRLLRAYLPVLTRKPGALRNGAPFKDWDLPAPLSSVRAKLQHHVDDDRQFVKILARVPEDGIAAVADACAEALEAGIANGDVVMAILARKRQPPIPPSITTPDALKLKAEPIADCARYDNLRKGKEA